MGVRNKKNLTDVKETGSYDVKSARKKIKTIFLLLDTGIGQVKHQTLLLKGMDNFVQTRKIV